MDNTLSPTQTSTSVAFIGLGTMGYPMAGHLARAGHKVAVYNRSATKATAWLAEYKDAANALVHTAATPRAAAEGSDFVMLCMGNDNDVRQVALGPEGALAGMAAGAVLVDHTTASVELAQTLDAACTRQGLGFVDAPVSGGQAGAQNGNLTVMCGAQANVFERTQTVLSSYAHAVTHIGPVGSGQLAKMVNQICIAGLLQGLSEALAFGQKAGLNMPLVLDAIGAGAAQSWQLDNRGVSMLADQFDFGFAVDWMRKDLGLALEKAKNIGAQLPVTELVDRFYAALQTSGYGRLDTSSLIKLLH